MSSHPQSIAYPQQMAPPSARTIAAAVDQLAFGALCVFTFALSWERGQGPTILPMTGAAMFGLALLSSWISPRKRPLCEVHHWLIAFAMWSSLSVFWTVDWDATLLHVATFVQLVCMAWVVWVLVDTESRLLTLMKVYILGTFVCCYGTFSNLLAGRTYGQLDDLEGPKSSRYMMTGMNPNDVGLVLAPGMAMSLYLLAKGKGNPIVCWLQFVACSTTILLSGSRGSMLASVSVVMLFPLVFRKMPGWQRKFAIVALAGAVAAAAYFVPPDTWQRMLNLGRDMMQGTMTHRTQIWAASTELFRQHPLFGVGSTAHPAAVVKIVARPLVAHNTFLSVLVELGVIGALIFVGLISALFLTARRMHGVKKTLWTLILVGWCIGANGGTWEYRKATWFLFGMVAAHSYVQRRQNLCVESRGF